MPPLVEGYGNTIIRILGKVKPCNRNNKLSMYQNQKLILHTNAWTPIHFFSCALKLQYLLFAYFYLHMNSYLHFFLFRKYFFLFEIAVAIVVCELVRQIFSDGSCPLIIIDIVQIKIGMVNLGSKKRNDKACMVFCCCFFVTKNEKNEFQSWHALDAQKWRPMWYIWISFLSSFFFSNTSMSKCALCCVLKRKV